MRRSVTLVLLFTSLAFSYECFSATFPGKIKWVDIGVNGLTCSMCTRSVEMSIRKLDFVQDIKMSLEKAEGRIYFKSGMPTNLNDIAKAIVNAGFSVEYVSVHLDLSEIPVDEGGNFIYEGQKYLWLNYEGVKANEITLKLVEEKFLPKKELLRVKKEYARQFASGDQTTFYALSVD